MDAAKAGIRYHLTKPVRQSRLLEAISLDDGAGGARSRWVRARAAGRKHTIHSRSEPDPGAEDEDVNWLSIERMPDKGGHVAVRARDGRRTDDALVPGHYDLVLKDCQVPVLDG